MKNLWILPLVALVTSSCTSLVKVPIGTSRFAEVEGKKVGFSLGLGNIPTRVVYVAQDSEKGDESITNLREESEYINSTTTGLSLGLTVFEKFALYSDAGHNGLQWQMIGDNMQGAKSGNFAVSLLYGQGSTSLISGTIEMANTGNYLNGQLDAKSELAALLISFRFNDSMGMTIDGFGQKITATGLGSVISAGGSTVNAAAIVSEETTDTGAAIGFFVAEGGLKAGIKYTVIQVKDPITEEVGTVGAIGAAVENTF